MLSEQLRRRLTHTRDVERAILVMREPAQRRGRIAPIEDRVKIAPFERGVARGKIGRDARRVARAQIGRQRRIERDRKFIDGKRIMRAKRDDLAGGVNARVGAPGSRHFHGPIEQPREHSFEFSRDRSQFRLKLKSAEIRALVLDDDTVGRVFRVSPPGRASNGRGAFGHVAFLIEVEQIRPRGDVRAVRCDRAAQFVKVLLAVAARGR